MQFVSRTAEDSFGRKVQCNNNPTDVEELSGPVPVILARQCNESLQVKCCSPCEKTHRTQTHTPISCSVFCCALRPSEEKHRDVAKGVHNGCENICGRICGAFRGASLDSCSS
uniref:(northern house mosquito) hypothetical protein n=1 Tax=Culex pipiens TaxID=7175 RepID=A0A8D8A8B0_CULPI